MASHHPRDPLTGKPRRGRALGLALNQLAKQNRRRPKPGEAKYREAVCSRCGKGYMRSSRIKLRKPGLCHACRKRKFGLDGLRLELRIRARPGS